MIPSHDSQASGLVGVIPSIPMDDNWCHGALFWDRYSGCDSGANRHADWYAGDCEFGTNFVRGIVDETHPKRHFAGSYWPIWSLSWDGRLAGDNAQV